MAIDLKGVGQDAGDSKNLVIAAITGKLEVGDYEFLVPQLERLIEREGKIRVLVRLIDFHGWTASALWEDTKFAAKHFNDVERFAIVGDQAWQKGLTYFSKPFTAAEVRYFDSQESNEAERWIREESTD